MRIFATFAVCLVGVFTTGTGVVRAQEAAGSFTVTGQVRNATVGAATPPDLLVRVVGVQPDGTAQTWEAPASTDGSFRVDGVARLEGATYVLGVEYGGATYVERVEPPGLGGTASRDLQIFESVSTDPGVRFEQSAVVLAGVDEATRTMTVLEVHTLINPGDRTFTPRADGPGGPAGLLVFGLPPNASDVTPEFGLNSAFLVQIDRGFASLNPVYPGRSELGFRYRLPYTDAQFLFNRNIRYPTSSFQVLVSSEGLSVESAQLVPADAANVGGRQMKRHGGGPFTPGAAVAFTIQGLPLPGGPLARIPVTAVAMVGVVLGLLALAGGWAYGKGMQPAQARGRDPEEVADEIVALDLAYSAGEVDDSVYQPARRALLASVRRSGEPAEA